MRPAKMAKEKLTPWKVSVSASFTRNVFSSHAYSAYCATALFYPFYLPIIVLIEWWKQWQLDGFLPFIWGCIHPPVAALLPSGWQRLILMPALLATSGQLAVYGVEFVNCAPKNGLLATRKRTHIGSRNNFTVLRRWCQRPVMWTMCLTDFVQRPGKWTSKISETPFRGQLCSI